MNTQIKATSDFAAFGREVFERITARVSDMMIGEEDEEIMEIAERHGLAKQVPYKPEVHGEGMEIEPGDMIWWWGDIHDVKPAGTATLQTYAELAIEVEYAWDVDRIILVSTHINETAMMSRNILPCLGEPHRLAFLEDAKADYERRQKEAMMP